MDSGIGNQLKAKLRGVLPPVTMPFDSRGELVPEGLLEQIDFMIHGGASAVVVGGSTGEGHTLSDEEFKRALTSAHEATQGRVPFVAGIIANSTRQVIQRVKAIEDLKIDALQITPVHYLFKPDPDATVCHFREVWEQTHIPILIYNVIPWNYLNSELMLRVMDEVPGVVGIKQSSGDLKSLSDLLMACPDKIVLTGIDALLYPSFALGAGGAITALTSAIPSVIVKLYNAVQKEDYKTAKSMHFRLNALWNLLPHDILPACVKYIQHLQGLTFYHSRAPMPGVPDSLKEPIQRALEDALG